MYDGVFILLSLRKYFLVLIFFCHPFSSVYARNKPVDVVFCMDLSGSTNGLIDDLRDRMWDIIVRFQSASPDQNLRIGMVAYSRPSFGKNTGYAKVISPLTDDFDQLSNDLFSIKPYIEKGDQLVGAALQMSVKGINWSRESEAVKLIFLIGNGGVSLGSIDYRAICDEAQLKNFIVFPVFCTKANKSREITGWYEIARIFETEVKEIIIHKRSAIDPVCNNIQALKVANDKLNKSFIYYGDKGYNRFKQLKQADANAIQGGVLSFEARIFYKAMYMKGQHDWDLVDYLKVNGNLPLFDHNTLADTLKMIPDDNLLRSVVAAKERRNLHLAEVNLLLPVNRMEIIKKQTKDKQIDKDETLENIVVEAYFQALIKKGFKVTEKEK